MTLAKDLHTIISYKLFWSFEALEPIIRELALEPILKEIEELFSMMTPLDLEGGVRNQI